MPAVTYAYARKNLKALLDRTVSDRAPIIIARNRGENAVVIAESEWARIAEVVFSRRTLSL